MRMLYVAIFIHNKGNQMRFHGFTIKLAFEFCLENVQVSKHDR